MGKIYSFLKLMRPQQWFKSASLLFSAGILFFSIGISFTFVVKLLFAMFGVSLLSSSIYVFNDVSDVEKDRAHPVKKNRPIASGEISVIEGVIFGSFLIVSSFIILFLLKPTLVIPAFSMLFLSYLYSFKPFRLKDVPILDIIVPAMNFSIRVAIGWYALTNINIPFALLLFPFFIASFLLSCKRYAEYNFLGRKAIKIRNVFKFYDKSNLMFIINFNLVLSVVFYLLFALLIDFWLLILSPWFLVMLVWYKSFLRSKKSVVKKPEEVFVKKKRFTLALVLFCVSWLLIAVCLR